MSPKRIQRKRTKGWRMPEGAVYVGRPTRWGNPYPARNPYAEASGPMSPDEAVTEFRAYMARMVVLQRQARVDLAGKDLACWCPLDQPCHADVLLELANGADEEGAQ